jgi:putative salt-induced outer membrane protein YdiY
MAGTRGHRPDPHDRAAGDDRALTIFGHAASHVFRMIAIALLFALQADTLPARAPAVVKFTGEIGYVASSGNSSVETLNLGDRFSLQVDDVLLTQTFTLIYGESKGQSVSSLYRGSMRAEKGLKTSRASAFTLLNFERNTFAGLASRWSGTAGLSANVLSGERDRLVLESGLTLTRQRSTSTTGRDIDFIGGRAASTFTHRFSAKASVIQVIEVLPNFREGEDLRLNTESTLTAPITSRVAVKLSYVIRYDGLPETGFQTTDRLFTSGIQVSL